MHGSLKKKIKSKSTANANINTSTEWTLSKFPGIARISPWQINYYVFVIEWIRFYLFMSIHINMYSYGFGFEFVMFWIKPEYVINTSQVTVKWTAKNTLKNFHVPMLIAFYQIYSFIFISIEFLNWFVCVLHHQSGNIDIYYIFIVMTHTPHQTTQL